MSDLPDLFRRDQSDGISASNLADESSYAEHIVHARGKRTREAQDGRGVLPYSRGALSRGAHRRLFRRPAGYPEVLGACRVQAAQVSGRSTMWTEARDRAIESLRRITGGRIVLD